MENENFVTRVTRGAQKRPEARMDEDIDAILSVTQEVSEAAIFYLHSQAIRREYISCSVF